MTFVEQNSCPLAQSMAATSHETIVVAKEPNFPACPQLPALLLEGGGH